VSEFAQQVVAGSLAAIAQDSQKPGVDEIGKKDAVAGFDLGADWVSRMPCVLADRERIAGVGDKFHLTRPGQRSVRQAFVKDGADMGRGSIVRQIELHRGKTDRRPWLGL